VPIVLKSGSLKLLESSEPVQDCNGIDLPVHFLNYKPHSLLVSFVSYYFVSSEQVEGLADKVTWREVVIIYRDWFWGYLMMLFQLQISQNWMRMKRGENIDLKRSICCLCQGAVLTLSWLEWEKPLKASIQIAKCPGLIRTWYLANRLHIRSVTSVEILPVAIFFIIDGLDRVSTDSALTI
jgi:hypothetical protein